MTPGPPTPTVNASVRAGRVPPFHAMAMSRLASEREAAGRRVLHLEVGQPSTGAPADAVAALAGALDRPLGYTDANGIAALRRRIAAHYQERHGVSVDPDRVVVVAGASAGFTLAFLAAFDAGARVGVLEPGYPCYRNALHALGMEPVAIPVDASTRWGPTPETLAAAGPLDGLVIASPSNPTGTVLDASTLADIVAHCQAAGTRLIADEIYHGITYGPDPAPTVLAATGQAVVVNSFSKYYSMTGWRIGWAVVPGDLIDAVVRLQQNLYICASHPSQVVALAAMDATDELDAHVARYAVNRAALLDGLTAAGVRDVADADGAFYVYADVGELLDRIGGGDAGGDRPGSRIGGGSAGGDGGSMALCRRWLDELGVAATPGVDFDLVRGHRFVRFSYAGRTDHVHEACELLAGWIRERT